MSQLAASPVAVLDRLSHVSAQRGAPSLAERLASLDRWVRSDLVEFERELDVIPRGGKMIHQAAHHLLDLRGKHLRPLCVAMTSRFGEGFTERARSLAVAVELVHSATLLHDDVVDVAERRRGQPTASVVYGNAASIFAGDWLLIAALRRIRQSGVEGVLDRMLGVIDEMIAAESVQLERRGKIAGAREDYFAIVEGKTAALFRWAMIAGARCADLPASSEAALERYGLHLGVAFQAVDDELDFREGTGKDALADLREGKITFPLVIALEREPSLRGRMEALLAREVVATDELSAIATAVRNTGALAATRTLAEEHVQRAIDVLDELPAVPARDALVTVALASLERQS
ncbi:MAG: polyprenyl synthetase family protein [Deltaproteobacteria bacterium]|nr:polyprenyl synthetase family protein [Deltaproteobacteria bacterium]